MVQSAIEPHSSPGKRVAIVQSNYIPWKGYFDLIARVDEFILFDDMQFTKRDWRNRTQIKTRDGVQWLSIPVRVKGRYLQKIKDTEISDPEWAPRHWRTIAASYARAPFFASYRERFEDLYLGSPETRLSAINRRFIGAICGMLSIDTKLSWSMDYDVPEGKTERLVSLCLQAGAAEYVSGPSARDYLEPETFARNGIALTFMSYDGYKEYEQLYPPFTHHVSVLDLLFSTGPAARQYLLSGGR